MACLVYLMIFVLCIQMTSSHENAYLNTERNRQILEGQDRKLVSPSMVTPLASWMMSSVIADRNGRGIDTGEDGTRTNEEKLRIVEEEDGSLLDRIQHHLEELQNQRSDRVAAASDSCLNDTQTLISGIQNGEIWAIQMLDSFGKPGSDILRGKMDWLGSYDECFSVTIHPSVVDFKSRYCKVMLVPSDYLNQTNPSITLTMAYLGLCLPDTCSNMDITFIMTDLLTSLNISMLPNVECFQKEVSMDTKAIVAIIICSVFGVLVLLGTAYDVISERQKEETEEPTKTPLNDKYGTDGREKQNHTEKEPLLSESTSLSVEDSQVVLETEQDRSLRPVGKKTKDRKPEISEDKAIWVQLLLAFSAYTNGAKILNTKQSPGSLTAIHGIRFLSMTWVILGHCFSSVMGFGSSVSSYLQEHVKWWTFHGILNALVSVDTFFALSGLLVSYLTLKELKRGSGKTNWFMFYFHRFWRLTPVYMMTLMFYVCLFQYLGDGPLWAQSGLQTEDCENNWWTNLLYVNNIVNRNNMCFSWAWYLANDMQFYILSPLILIPLYYSEYVGMAVIGFFMIGTMTTAGLISRLNNLPAGVLYLTKGVPGPDDYALYYMSPYCRMGPYLVGMLAGYFMYKHQGKTISNKNAVCGWLLATASALAVLYGPYDSANGTPMTSDVAALYNAVHRSVWGAAVCWVVIACATRKGGFVNTLMSWSGFVPLSRLSYCAYLTHPMVLTLQFMTQRSIFYLTDINIIYNFLGFLVATYGVSLVVSLTFEAPMMGLERVLFKRERRN